MKKSVYQHKAPANEAEAGGLEGQGRTLALLVAAIDAGASDHNIMHYSEAALAADPLTIAREYAAIVKDSGLVKQHSTVMNGSSERHLVRMEEVEA